MTQLPYSNNLDLDLHWETNRFLSFIWNKYRKSVTVSLTETWNLTSYSQYTTNKGMWMDLVLTHWGYLSVHRTAHSCQLDKSLS